jgi:hypothetical protein
LFGPQSEIRKLQSEITAVRKDSEEKSKVLVKKIKDIEKNRGHSSPLLHPLTSLSLSLSLCLSLSLSLSLSVSVSLSLSLCLSRPIDYYLDNLKQLEVRHTMLQVPRFRLLSSSHIPPQNELNTAEGKFNKQNSDYQKLKSISLSVLFSSSSSALLASCLSLSLPHASSVEG